MVESNEALKERDSDVWSGDPRSHVGSRHHTVPRFLLDRWADANGQVLVYGRVEARRVGACQTVCVRA